MLLGGVGEAFVAGAQSASTAMLAGLGATTEVDLSAEWFRSNVAVLAAVTLPVVVGLFVLQVIGSVLRREPGGLLRALLGVGRALLGAALALALTQSALIVSDEVSNAVAAAAGTSVTDAARRFTDVSYLLHGTAGLALQLVLGLAMMLASFVLWAVLLFRKAAILLIVVFAPIAFAGAVWDSTRVWVRRWVEAVAALVFCKVVIVVTFVVGAAAFGSSADGDAPGAGLSDVLVGLLLLGIAAFSPWLAWRFVHWSGSEVAEAMHATVAASPIPGRARRAVHSAGYVALAAAGQPLVASGVAAMRGSGRRATPSPAPSRAGATQPPPRATTSSRPESPTRGTPSSDPYASTRGGGQR